MKKLLLSFMIIWQATIILAQTFVYKPFPSKMIIYWGMETTTAYPPTQYESGRFEIIGDTIFNGIHYSKTYSGTTISGGIRNDTLNKRVYSYSISTGIEKLLYDFNMSVGDTVYRNNGYGFYPGGPGVPSSKIDTAWVSRIDSILMPHDGLYHKQFHFNAKIKDPTGSNYSDILISSDSSGPYADIDVQINPLVEGVGQINGSMSYYFFFEYQWISKIFCASINEIPLVSVSGIPKNPEYNSALCNTLFIGIYEEDKTEKRITLFPNPSTGQFQLTLNYLKENNFEITDVLGNTILRSEIKNETTEIDLSDHSSGVYFVRVNDSQGNFVVRKIVKE